MVRSIALFGKYGVFSERELHSRYEILLEGYTKTIAIESLLTKQIASRQVLPAALRYQTIVAEAIKAMSERRMDTLILRVVMMIIR